MKQGFFVTGTDTGVGKTRIAAALCRAFAARGWRVAAMKPVASGCERTAAGLRNADAEALLSAMTVPATYVEVNPYAFEPAIAPHLAAAEAGCEIDLALLDARQRTLAQRSDLLVVEGAGGWLAPLDATRTFADLAVRWHLDAVLVVSLRLGCLNHALLTEEAIARRGVRLRGWVGNAVEHDFERREANIQTLRNRIAAPCLAIFPHAPASTAADFAKRFLESLPELATHSSP